MAVVAEILLVLAGLWLLECEFPDEAAAQAFKLPEWAAGAQEVTEEARFKNRSLATQGLTDLDKSP